MGIEHIGRLVIFNDSQANVELADGALAELVFGRNSATGAIGYSIDQGANWVWLPISSVSFNDSEGDPVDVDSTAAADGTSVYAARRDHRHHLGSHSHGAADITGQYRQLLWEVSGGTFTFLTDASGNPLEALMDLE